MDTSLWNPSLRSLSSEVTKNRLRLGGTILDISSLRGGSDLYGELFEPHENARASGVPFPFRVLLSRDSSQLPLACEEALHLGERETSSLVCHSSVDFSRYFLNGEFAGKLGLFFQVLSFPHGGGI